MVKLSEAVVQRCSLKKVFLEISQKSQENTSVRVSFLIKLKALGVEETLAQVFSCEFCKISNNTFSYRTPPAASSELCQGTSINGFQILYVTENF